MELQRAIELAHQLLEKHGVDRGHGIDHALAVLQHAQRALEEEDLGSEQQLAVQLAALLHDVDDHKFFQTAGLANARAICEKAAPNRPALLENVLRMIDLVSCSKNGNSSIEPRWLLIPRYADRLEALGDIGIYRCYAYTVHVQRPVCNPDTPLPRSEAELEALASPDRFNRYVRSGGKVGSSTFIDHFYDKLLHIANLDTSNRYLRETALQRRRDMVAFLLRFADDPQAALAPFVEKFKCQC